MKSSASYPDSLYSRLESAESLRMTMEAWEYAEIYKTFYIFDKSILLVQDPMTKSLLS